MAIHKISAALKMGGRGTHLLLAGELCRDALQLYHGVAIRCVTTKTLSVATWLPELPAWASQIIQKPEGPNYLQGRRAGCD
jgi:hypothetical protein